MARLLLEQGHWQEARRMILALMQEGQENNTTLAALLRHIDTLHPEVAAGGKRRERIRQAQQTRLTAMLNRLTSQT
jgi:hypothetical protein